MHSKRIPLILLVLALVATEAGHAKSKKKKIQEALALTPEHFFSTATVKDDSLDTVATITTVNGFQDKRGLLGIVWDDNFLRAFIDKESGSTTYQLYQIIYYQGANWNFYQQINYETDSGPKSEPVTIIHRDVDCTGSRYTGCTYEEHVAFAIEEDLLRNIAALYSPGHPVGWNFKFSAKSGKEYRDGMLPAEVAGLLNRVDKYKLNNGILLKSAD